MQCELWLGGIVAPLYLLGHADSDVREGRGYRTNERKPVSANSGPAKFQRFQSRQMVLVYECLGDGHGCWNRRTQCYFIDPNGERPEASW